jgi:hypothetical protein
MNIVPMQWRSLVLNDMRRDGISRLPITFPDQDVIEHLVGAEVFNAHVAAKATASAKFGSAAMANWPMFCHSMQDIVTAPHILETALSLYPLVQDYFGEPPLLYSMNAFWTQPVPPNVPKYADTHWWHIDGDDRQQLVVFFMGTDIPTKEDGAHLYQRGSHKFYPNPSKERLGYDYENPHDSIVAVMTGSAGTIFLSDPRGMHMAPRPKSKPRMLAWARFGVSDPPVSYGWDKLSPVPRALIGDRFPSDPVLQQAIHLVCS